jgi:hypothetical protein
MERTADAVSSVQLPSIREDAHSGLGEPSTAAAEPAEGVDVSGALGTGPVGGGGSPDAAWTILDDARRRIGCLAAEMLACEPCKREPA